MYSVLRRLLFLLPPEAAHHIALFALTLLDGAFELCAWMRWRAIKGLSLETTVAGLRFDHPLGLAAGLDKDALAVTGLFALGFAFVEVGTLTPRPQPGNPKPRLFRLPEEAALINRMGFNNEGAAAAAGRLRELEWRPGPVGVNVGKNKDTPLEQAAEDYLACVEQLAPLADYVVVNASSPNTPGLRQLQEPQALEALLRAVRGKMREVAPGRPLFLKIAPDLSPDAIDGIVDVALGCEVDGLIATNTTLARPISEVRACEPGGLSGKPLCSAATEVIRRAYARGQGRLPIIGVGGVFDGADAYEKIRAGASLVQLYTGFVYGGPGVVRRATRELAALLKRDGFAQVADAVGIDVRREKSQAPAALGSH